MINLIVLFVVIFVWEILFYFNMCSDRPCILRSGTKFRAFFSLDNGLVLVFHIHFSLEFV